jgi:hypothetical protein
MKYVHAVAPFTTPVNISGDTETVRFEIYWDLTDLIEQYQGLDNTANTADDIFVLKDGWWNGLYITASVQ